MNFICTNPSCAIALSKASFPVAMNCPVCQTLLVNQEEEPAISAEDETLIASIPYVIAYPLRRTLAEKHMWTKVNLLKDTFLNYLKYLGLLSASEFFHSNLKDKKMVALFQQALAEPSFGSWNQYIRETLQFLKDQQHTFFCAELVDYYEAVETGKKRKLYKGEIEYIDSNGDVQLKKQEATAIGMLINFRNRYLGHGLTLDEKAAQQLWDEYFPLFRTLLEQMQFASQYTMFKHEHGETYKMQSAEISIVEKGAQISSQVWLENPQGAHLNILPFFIVPGEVSLAKEDKEQILAYESYTGKTIKFFSPEGTEKQSSGKILEKLNLLLRDKQKEKPYAPDNFTKEIFKARLADENKLILDTLISEKKVIPGVYVHREDMEIKLREWIGARMSIFFIAAEAGSGKTNLLVEMQKQYTAREIPSLIIRAGRMEKQTLREQLAYLLNIDATQDLSNYKHVAVTQASPTMVLIDGLNEASQAEALWQEVLDISKTFEPGSLKFVVTSRANSKADIERYTLAESDENLVYGENKDHEQGLGGYIYWLSALNMAEMKNAWEDYVQRDKNIYKPQFSFDDLANFDRTLYNHISNPLVLRLFLETYNNKSLPNKGNKHLSIWADWLATFKDAEQEFFKLLADAIWEKGENELLLDDVLRNKNLKPYFTDDRINAPYPRLKNKGWISRYVKNLNTCVAFTVEGGLLYLLGNKLMEQSLELNILSVKKAIKSGAKLQQPAIESFLSQKALNGDLTLISELIETNDEFHNVCINPLLLNLKTFGAKAMIEVVLSKSSENYWKALLKLDEAMEEMEMHVLRMEFLEELMPLNPLQTKETVLLGLRSCLIFDFVFSKKYLKIIDDSFFSFSADTDLLTMRGHIECNIGAFDEALETFYKTLEIELVKYGEKHLSVAALYGSVGWALQNKGEYTKAFEFYQKCLDIQLNLMGNEQIGVAISYGYIGDLMHILKDFDKSMDFQKKGLDILERVLGSEHPFVANAYNNIGHLFFSYNDFVKASEFHNNSLTILLRTYGDEHPFIAATYNNMGNLLFIEADYEKALDFYLKSLDINMKIHGDKHFSIAINNSNIGHIFFEKGLYEKALKFYQKGLEIQLTNRNKDHSDLATLYLDVGLCHYKLKNNNAAFELISLSLKIKLKTRISSFLNTCRRKLNIFNKNKSN